MQNGNDLTPRLWIFLPRTGLLCPVALLILFQMINRSVRNHVVKGFLQMQSLKYEKSRPLAIQYTQQLVVVSACFCFHLISSSDSCMLPTMINQKQSIQYLKVVYMCTTHLYNSVCYILYKYLLLLLLCAITYKLHQIAQTMIWLEELDSTSAPATISASNPCWSTHQPPGAMWGSGHRHGKTCQPNGAAPIVRLVPGQMSAWWQHGELGRIAAE